MTVGSTVFKTLHHRHEQLRLEMRCLKTFVKLYSVAIIEMFNCAASLSLFSSWHHLPVSTPLSSCYSSLYTHTDTHTHTLAFLLRFFPLSSDKCTCDLPSAHSVCGAQTVEAWKHWNCHYIPLEDCWGWKCHKYLYLWRPCVQHVDKFFTELQRVNLIC